MSTSSPQQTKTLRGVLLAILILLILASGIDLIVLRPIAGHPALIVFIERCFYWLFVAVLWLYAVKEEKQPLLIWKENKYSIGTHISHLFALFFIIMISVDLINFLIPLLRHEGSSKLVPRLVDFFRKNPFLLVFTVLTAGVTEELIFRGYLQPRLELLLKNPYWAIFISS
ncbi:MAG TPA: CPBP family intramembrane glutamic endopeptidase, partial [Puia sp.]